MLFDKIVKMLSGRTCTSGKEGDLLAESFLRYSKNAAVFDLTKSLCCSKDDAVVFDIKDIVLPFPICFCEYLLDGLSHGALIKQQDNSSYSIVTINQVTIDGYDGKHFQLLFSNVNAITGAYKPIAIMFISESSGGFVCRDRNHSEEAKQILEDDKYSVFAGSFLAMLTSLSDSSNWIIERRDEKAIKRHAKAKKKRIARSHERPIYIAAGHEDLADKMHIPKYQRPARSFRGRRSCVRIYHHKRFYYKDKGDFIGMYLGKEHWVNENGKPRQQVIPHSYHKTNLPTETVNGNMHYRVCLERMARDPESEKLNK